MRIFFFLLGALALVVTLSRFFSHQPIGSAETELRPGGFVQENNGGSPLEAGSNTNGVARTFTPSAPDREFDASSSKLGSGRFDFIPGDSTSEREYFRNLHEASLENPESVIEHLKGVGKEIARDVLKNNFPAGFALMGIPPQRVVEDFEVILSDEILFRIGGSYGNIDRSPEERAHYYSALEGRVSSKYDEEYKRAFLRRWLDCSVNEALHFVEENVDEIRAAPSIRGEILEVLEYWGDPELLDSWANFLSK